MQLNLSIILFFMVILEFNFTPITHITRRHTQKIVDSLNAPAAPSPAIYII